MPGEVEILERAKYFLKKLTEHPHRKKYALRTLEDLEKGEVKPEITELKPGEDTRVGILPVLLRLEEYEGRREITHMGEYTKEGMRKSFEARVYRRGIDPNEDYGERAHAILEEYATYRSEPANRYSIVLVGEKRHSTVPYSVRFHPYATSEPGKGRVAAMVVRDPRTGKIYLIHFNKNQ